MFAAERIRVIKGILLEKKHISVTDLSALLNVSEVTIRRDLEKLEKENFLIRAHGGAYISDDSSEIDENEEELSDEDPYINDRIQISEIAAGMVEENESIILTSGKTNSIIAKKLVNKSGLTVLTNDLNIAAELSKNINIKVTIPGGELNASSMTVCGKLAEENIKKFFVSKAFIEVDGISMNRGFTVQSMDKASILKSMIDISNKKIFVGHYKLFDKIAFYQVGALELADCILTNINIPDSYKDYFFNNEIKLFTALKGEGDY